MALNFSHSSSAVCGEVHIARHPLRIVADPNVARFVSDRSLQADYARVLQRIEDVFAPERNTVEWVPSQEENGAGEDRLLFLVQCGLDRERFQAHADIFFEPLRMERPPIYFLIGLHRDAFLEIRPVMCNNSCMKTTLNITLPETLRREVKKLCRAKNQSVSDVVLESLQRYVAAERFLALRNKTLPFAEAQGFLADEDIFDAVS